MNVYICVSLKDPRISMQKCCLAHTKNYLQFKASGDCILERVFNSFSSNGILKSGSDPCLYFKNTDNVLVIWISWVDYCLLVGH
jgi:hypothetical protein